MPSWDAQLAIAHTSDPVLARLVSAMEDDNWDAIAAVGRRMSTSVRRSIRVGLTGAAGAGKSTLLAALSGAWPGDGRMGGIAVDPSSDMSGGAVLGDRFRLYGTRGAERPADARLFLRSMAARGSGKALSRHVALIATLFEEVGLSPVLMETAGAGQSDTRVKSWVDCLVLVLTPESGDVIQMLKAGLMEHADLYVVNKADRDGARKFAAQLRGLVASQHAHHPLAPARRVVLARADRADRHDLAPLISAIGEVASACKRSRHELWLEVIDAFLAETVMDLVNSELRTPQWSDAVARCASGELSGAEVARRFQPAMTDLAG